MSVRARFWVILALIAVTMVLCVAVTVRRIESDLLTRSQTALAMAGIPFYGVTVDGRDLVLRGFVSSPERAAQIRAIVAGLDGVREVRDEALVVERVVDSEGPGDASAPTLRPALLRVQRLGARLFMSGTVPPDGSAERFLRAACARFGDTNVTGGLGTRQGVDHPQWLDAADRLFEMLGAVSDNARLVVEGNTGVLSGEVSDAATGARVRDLAASIPGLDLRMELFSGRGPSSGAGDGR